MIHYKLNTALRSKTFFITLHKNGTMEKSRMRH